MEGSGDGGIGASGACDCGDAVEAWIHRRLLSEQVFRGKLFLFWASWLRTDQNNNCRM